MRTNEDAARVLDELGSLFGAVGDAHRCGAYQRAAASVRAWGARLTPQSTEAELQAIPGVGPAIAAKIREYMTSGRLRALDEMRAGLPREFGAFLRIRGIGPRTAIKLHRDLGVETLADLTRAAEDGRLRRAGLSDALRQRILREAPKIAAEAHRVLLVRALAASEMLALALRAVPSVRRVAIAGGARRGEALVDRLEVVAETPHPQEALAGIQALPDVREVVEAGPPLVVALASGLPAAIHLASAADWGAALVRASAAPAHLAALEARAEGRHLRFTNGALVSAHGRTVETPHEASVYAGLGLAWIPPELREGRGEIEAAEEGRLPRLVALDDLEGDLHMHTDATDGVAPLADMVEAARDAGRSYVAVTDHAHGLPVPHGMTEDELLARKRELASVTFPIPVLVGSEVNILGDGSLSLEDRALEELDLVVASVHSGLRDDRAALTRRIVDALSTGLVDVLGHPTTRRLPRRGEADIDFERVFDAAAEHDVALEINASPERMDLPGEIARRGKERGLRFTIDTDAHSPRELGNMPFGVAMARRGWLTPDDVLTTRPFPEFAAWLASRRRKPTPAGAVGGDERAGSAAGG